ncbi:MAG TPA: NAD-dependent epimerase/dehydratase family protein, partial [Tepidisphaeraceae bacterium]|nr:NAD-dependent epimerase/dehydratase family protein [Tepidisphaeraceae bacterium]
FALGGGGFIGTNLCRRLTGRGGRVRAFSRHFAFPDAMAGVDLVTGDFRNHDALASAIEGFDIVYHLVHATPPQPANVDIGGDITNNVLPSLALFDICRRLGVKRIVFLSSGGTVYGRAAVVPTPETAPTEPIAAYGISKLMIEKYLALHEHLHRMDYRVLRVTNPFGAFQTTIKNQGIIAALIARGLAGEPIEIWGDGSAVRDFIYVGDVIDALELASRDQSDFRIFNIGRGEGRNIREIVGMIERLLGRKLQIVWKDARAIDLPVSVVSNARAKEVLGWTPKTTLDEGLRQTIAWWQGGAP